MKGLILRKKWNLNKIKLEGLKKTGKIRSLKSRLRDRQKNYHKLYRKEMNFQRIRNSALRSLHLKKTQYRIYWKYGRLSHQKCYKNKEILKLIYLKSIKLNLKSILTLIKNHLKKTIMIQLTFLTNSKRMISKQFLEPSR